MQEINSYLDLMNDNLELLLRTINSYLLMSFVVYFFYKLVKIKGLEILRDIKGENKKLDLPELAGLVWLFMLIVILSGSLLFDLTVTNTQWLFMAGLGAEIMGGRVLMDYMETLKNNKNAN